MGNSDKAVITAFVAHLAKNGHEGLTVDAWLDVDEHKKGKRTESAIDAVAGKFAIEHTSIDALPNKREADASFTASIGCLEGQIVPFHLEIFVKMDAIAKGQKYAATREAVRRWIVEDAPALADGDHNLDAVPGVPFALFVRKYSNVKVHSAGVFVGRLASPDPTFNERMKATIDKKTPKLTELKGLELRPDWVRVLLIENGDVAFINDWLFAEAVRSVCAGGLPTGVDEVWYASTAIGQPRFVKLTNEIR